MARQTLNLGSGFNISPGGPVKTVSKSVSVGPVNSSLVAGGSANLNVSFISILSESGNAAVTGRIHLAFGALRNNDLTTAWENYSQAVKLAIQGGTSVTVTGPNHSSVPSRDDTEPYTWVPVNRAAVVTWAKQITSLSVILITLNDGVTAPTTLKFRASLDGSISGSLRASLSVTDTPATDPVEPVEPPVSANALKFLAVLEGYISGGVSASLRLSSVTVRPRPRPRPRSLKFLANLDGNIYGYINANSELSLVLNSVVNLDGDLQGIINASLVVTGLYKPIINLRYESGSVILDVPTGI